MFAGTCLGFESIVRASSNDETILSQFDAENIALTLKFTDGAEKIGRMFDVQRFGKNVQQIYKNLQTQPITMNNHQWGVSIFNWTSNSILTSSFDLLATSFDRENSEFVALIQNKQFPIYGAQFHPEKNVFEW